MTDAKELTLALGGRWHGCYGAAPCPVCQPQRQKSQNALTIADGRNGRLVLDCKKSACAFLDILAAVGVRSGDYCAPDPAELARREAERQRQAQRRANRARQLWSQARPLAGTIAETYLRGRGITCTVPETLRFHPDCWHPTSGRLPAMVALVQGGSSFAMHRTYLRTDGSGKAAVEPAKAMLGSARGGAVRLLDAQGPLVVAEGIETALSLSCGLLSGSATIWAALSTSGIRGLHLPSNPARLTIAPDGDIPGRTAAYALVERAHALGWQVSTLDPGDGLDFNDTLVGRAAA